MEPSSKLHAGFLMGARQSFRIHVRAIEEAALAFIAGQHHALVSIRGFAREGVIRACFLPGTQGG